MWVMRGNDSSHLGVLSWISMSWGVGLWQSVYVPCCNLDHQGLSLWNCTLIPETNGWLFYGGFLCINWLVRYELVLESIAILICGLEHLLLFPYIGNNYPNWLTNIFQRGWSHQPVSMVSCTNQQTIRLFGYPKLSSIWIVYFELGKLRVNWWLSPIL